MRGLLYTPLPALQKPTVFYGLWILGWYETSLLPKNGRQLRGIDHFFDDDLHHFGVIDTIAVVFTYPFITSAYLELPT